MNSNSIDPNAWGFMIEFNDPQWDLCDRDLAAGDFRYDDDEDYEDGEDYGDEWDGYADEAAASALTSPAGSHAANTPGPTYRT